MHGVTLSASFSIGTLLLGTALSSAAFAQNTGFIVLDTITLIGTGLPTEVMDNPASITVIEGEALRKSAPVSVAALLRDVPGVQINEEGIERISIRGETSRRVAILIDGQKLTDHTNYGQPVLVDPTTIERIEVVRGSSSVVSGSRAIGGVINIVTKRGAEKPFALSATAGYLSATEGFRYSATASGTVDAGAGKLDYRFSLGRMEQGDRRTPDGVLSSSDVSDRSISGHVGYRLGDHYFGFKAQQYDLAANVYTGNPAFLISLPNRDLRKYGAFYEGTDLTPWLKKLSVDAYRQTIDRNFSNDITTPAGAMTVNVLSVSQDAQLTYGANLRAEMQFSDRSRTVAGLEYEDDGMETDKRTVSTVIRPAPLPPIVTTTLRYDDASIRTLSAFFQHEIDLGRDLTATFGGRWYDVTARHRKSTTNGAANPVGDNSDSLGLASVGLVWTPDETLALRANVSQGYIYPTLGQMFLTTTAGGTTITGNPDLKPERATTFEFGSRMSRGNTVLDATLFYADATDYIATVMTGATGTYQNVDAARSWGLELMAEYRLEELGLSPYVSAVAMRRELEYANGFKTRDSGIPTLAGRIGLRKDWELDRASGSLDLFMRGESAVDFRDDSGAVTASSGGYGTLNLHANMRLDNGVMLTAEFNNLTNRSYTPYGQMPGAERSVNLFVSYEF